MSETNKELTLESIIRGCTDGALLITNRVAEAKAFIEGFGKNSIHLFRPEMFDPGKPSLMGVNFPAVEVDPEVELTEHQLNTILALQSKIQGS